jgi:hypothetical protein
MQLFLRISLTGSPDNIPILPIDQTNNGKGEREEQNTDVRVATAKFYGKTLRKRTLRRSRQR